MRQRGGGSCRAGAGLPGASEVSKAEWIEVKSVQNPAGLHSAQRKYGLGPGEMSTIFLAKELVRVLCCSMITGRVNWRRQRALRFWGASACLKPFTYDGI